MMDTDSKKKLKEPLILSFLVKTRRVLSLAIAILSFLVLVMSNHHHFLMGESPTLVQINVKDTGALPTMSSVTSKWLSKDDLILEKACQVLKKTVLEVGSLLQDPHNVSTNPSWIPPTLDCTQLIRGLPHDYWFGPEASIYLQRLVDVVQRLEGGEHVDIVVIGGSVTRGHRDDLPQELNTLEGAWPQKLEMLLQKVWPNITIHNHSWGGWNEGLWQRNFHLIKRMEPFDLIVGEFAVNDHCQYWDMKRPKEVNETSFLLLNELVWLPSKPAVLSFEMFRLATTREKAEQNCREHAYVTGNNTWVSMKQSVFSVAYCLL
jgi:hypothetical protein